MAINQVAWGHCCAKPTWLYFVAVDHAAIVSGIRRGGRPTHRVTSGPRGPRLPSATKIKRRLTPPALAHWLVELAATASRVWGAA